MSWRQRTGGGTGGVTAVRGRQPNRPVYEDFQPQIDTNEEEGARVVVVHVPGFSKEQMKITSDQGTNIKVHGQRPLLDNRWSRFNLLLPVPQNCDIHKIQAKFHNGLLTITMPKEVPKITMPSPAVDKPVAKTTRQEINDTTPSKATEGSKVGPFPVSESNKKATAAAELRTQKGQGKTLQTSVKNEVQKNERDAPTRVEKLPQKTDLEAPKGEKRPGENANRDEKPKDVKMIGQGKTDERVEKQREVGGGTRVLDSTDPLKSLNEKIQPKSHRGQDPTSSRQSYADRNETLKEAEKSLEKGKESTQKGKESAEAPPTDVAAVSKKMIDDGKKAVEKVASGAPNEDGKATNGNKRGIKYIAEAAKQTMTNVVKKLNEDDRQMLINIGAAVLVLVALGAYVSFGNFGSTAESEN